MVWLLWSGMFHVCHAKGGRRADGKPVSRGVLRTISSQRFPAFKFRSPLGSLRSSDRED